MPAGDGSGPRRIGRLWPWICVLAAAVLMAAETVITVQNNRASGQGPGLFEWFAIPVMSLLPLSFVLLGAFIETRRPGNRIGRLMMVVGLGFAAGTVATDYPGVFGSHHFIRPFGLAVVWISTWIWFFFLSGLLSLLLLFPNGELPSRRWRMVLWGGVGAFAIAALLGAIRTGPTDNAPIDNPLGFIPVPGAVTNGLLLCAFGAVGLAVVSLVVRYRASRGEVREQLKWFTYGALIALPLILAAAFTTWSGIVTILAFVAVAALPVFMGIAVLRYRLYDIDVLINRTLLWVGLTLSLGALYISAVILLQALFRSITGQASDLAVALATLAVAALFNPYRRRLQEFIDRRFYRRKYDAVRILGSLSATLRNDVDLHQVTNDITSAVHETMQPAHISIWLR